jgi:hypothetical protein
MTQMPKSQVAGQLPLGRNGPQAEQDERRLHRPDDEIRDRPSLKVKPAKHRDASGGKAAAKPVKAATPASAKQKKQPKKQAKKISLPPPEEVEMRYAFATHRPAPPDRSGEKKELASVNASVGRREVSTGFVLGVALIVAVLLAGILIARLQSRVGALEHRLSLLEGGGTPAEGADD